MTFEMVSFTYDPTRKLASLGRQMVSSSDGGTTYQYNPVPYDIGFQLTVMAKNAEDGTRIIEQILPFFTPDFTATLNLNPDTNLKVDVPIILNDVSHVDEYEGSFDVRRLLTWTLVFTMKGWLYGPSRKAELIKHIDVNINVPPSNISTRQANSTNTSNLSSIAIYGGMYANGEAVSWEGGANSSQHPVGYVDPYSLEKDDNWGFIIDFSSDE